MSLNASKIIMFLLIISSLGQVAFTALAQDYVLPEYRGTGRTALADIVYRIANFVFYALVVISTLFILYGAYQYLIGDPKSGKEWVINAAIAITVGLFAKILPALIYSVIGGELGGGAGPDHIELQTPTTPGNFWGLE